ncbi:uncharacterized protein LOC143305105 isoform X3 [Bombus vancouverensis nearcticus]|uniref:uncharacterized protein LOC143305105 isoform X3 n=1 Tax=Bombus vancouverensis nearcticus TaxID=2705178 RepID=UPI00402B6BA5
MHLTIWTASPAIRAMRPGFWLWCMQIRRAMDSKSIWFREWRTGALQFYGADCYSLD